MAEKAQFSGQVPNDLVKAIVEGRSLAFVGSGLSAAVQRTSGKALPSWKTLIEEMLDYARFESVHLAGFEEDLEKAISSGSLIMAAQELEERMGNAAFTGFMRRVFLDPSVRPAPVHMRLVEVPFRGVLTTNYDALIEGAYAVKLHGRIPPVYTQEDVERVSNPLRTDGVFVFKLHGDINRPETMVLGSHDYQDWLFRRPGYRSLLETIFTVNTVLFVGIGLNDPDVEQMLDRLASIFARTNEFHYALVPKGRFTSLEQRRLALDKRVKVIEYDNSDGNHQQVEAFLTYLYEITAPAGRLRQEYVEKISAVASRRELEVPEYASVAISYASEDKQFVQRLAEDLAAAGIAVWYDEWAIRVGDSIVSRIEEGIRSAEYMLVVLSRSYFRKAWPRHELEAALVREHESKGVFVLPALIDDAALDKMPPILRSKHYLDFRSNYDRALAKLIDFLRR